MTIPRQIVYADEMLKKLNEVHGQTAQHLFPERIHDKIEDKVYLREIIVDKLVYDGYITVTPSAYKGDKGFYQITFDGGIFIKNGGYEVKYIDEQTIKQLNKDQLQSVISTNESVKSTNKYQKVVLGATLLLSVISLAISYIALTNKDVVSVQPVPVTLKLTPITHSDTLHVTGLKSGQE